MEKTYFNLQSISNLVNRSKTLTPLLLCAYIPIILILAIISWQAKIPLSHLTRDPLVIVEEPFYIGILSNIGILFWCSAVAICLFSFTLLRNYNRSRKMNSFILASGLLTLVLLLDDFFMVHEEVAPEYLLIPEKAVYGIYAGLLSYYLIKFRKTILETDFSLLLLALGWFALSVVFDKGLIPLPASWLQRELDFYLEDTTKLLGIFSWFMYQAKVCGDCIAGLVFEGTDSGYAGDPKVLERVK